MRCAGSCSGSSASQPPRIGDGEVILAAAGFGIDVRQVVEDGRELALQRLALLKLPRFEFGCIGQGKAGQKLAAIEVGGAGQRLDAGFAQMRVLVAVGDVRLLQPAKAQHVDAQVRLDRQRDLAVVALQADRVERCVQRVDGVAQVGARPRLAQFRPEERGQHVTLVCALRHGKVGQQSNRLATR